MDAARSRSGSFRALDVHSLMYVVLACGFLVSAIEVRFLHRTAAAESPVAWLPTVASVLGLAASLIALAKSGAARTIAVTILATVLLLGMAGLYFHTKLKPGPFVQLFSGSGSPIASHEMDDDDDEHSYEAPVQEAEKEASPPALAPLSLVGLAALGILAAFGTGKRLEE